MQSGARKQKRKSGNFIQLPSDNHFSAKFERSLSFSKQGRLGRERC